MDPDGTERERALEERLARLEARLRRLEGAANLETATAAPAAEATPVTPRPSPAVVRPSPISAPSSTWGAGVPQRRSRSEGSRDRQDVPPLAAPAQLAQGAPPAPRPATGPSGWVNPPSPFQRPSVRIPSLDLTGSLNDIEERLAGRALAWVGGLALVLGVIFFLSLAFTRGWIGPELRVVMGLVAGSVSLGGGATFMERKNRLLGHVLTPVGLAIISISLVAATRLYGLVPVEVGLAGALASAIAAAIIAVRANSQVVAAFGLVAVLIAPPIMGATPDLVTLLFVAIVLMGTTGIALWRSWPWLPPVAFILSAPQAASWVAGDPDLAIGLAGISLYWLLNIVAAGGEAFRRRSHELTTSSASLLLANAAFLVWAGFAVLDGSLVTYRGLFLVLVALAHLGIGGYFVARDGERNLFGLLAIGTGIAALTMAAPIQLGASAVPIAWTAEAVALAWLAARRGHPYSAVVSGLLYAMAGTYLGSLYEGLDPPSSGIAFADAAGASLGFFSVGVAAGIWLVRDRSLRSALASYGLVVALWCVPMVLVPPLAAIAITLLMVVGTVVWRALPILPNAPIAWQVDGLIPRALQHVGAWRPPTDRLLPIAVSLIGLAASVQILFVYGTAIAATPPSIPFVDPAGAALTVYLVGLAVVALLSGRSRLREPLAALGLIVTAWACVAEFDGVVLVAAWAGLMVLGFASWRGLALLPHERPMILGPGRSAWTLDLVLPLAALIAGWLAFVHVLAVELPLTAFGQVLPPEIPFTDGGAASALVLTIATLATGALVPGARVKRVAILLAFGVVAYAIPYEVFAWAVSVLWVGLGGLALVLFGLDRSDRQAFMRAAMFLVAAAAAVAVGIVAPPPRLVVGTGAVAVIVVIQSIAAQAAVVAGLVAIARIGRDEVRARWVWLAAGVAVVYMLSIAVVDVVATQVGGGVVTDELRTRGQVALSVLWAVLGLSAFVAGLRLRSDDLRHGGLALLALATAKVFLFDLSALDVAYRVISLIALGLLLLTSAWVWQRLQPGSPGQGRQSGS